MAQSVGVGILAHDDVQAACWCALVQHGNWRRRGSSIITERYARHDHGKVVARLLASLGVCGSIQLTRFLHLGYRERISCCMERLARELPCSCIGSLSIAALGGRQTVTQTLLSRRLVLLRFTD